jgi:hypothetical protein
LGLFYWWLQAYGSMIAYTEGIGWGWLGLGFLLMLTSPLVQVWRTSFIFERKFRTMRRPVLICHGVNAILPVLGDVLELGWLSRLSDLSLREVVFRCLVRMLFTLSVTLAAVGFALGAVFLTLLGLLAPVLVTATFSMWWPLLRLEQSSTDWIRLRSAPYHFALAAIQLMIESLAFVCLARAVGLSLELWMGMGIRSVVEWTTYLPVPLSGLGLHHIGITESAPLFNSSGESLASHAVLHHGVLLLSAMTVGALAWFVFRVGEDDL